MNTEIEHINKKLMDVFHLYIRETAINHQPNDLVEVNFTIFGTYKSFDDFTKKFSDNLDLYTFLKNEHPEVLFKYLMIGDK